MGLSVVGLVGARGGWITWPRNGSTGEVSHISQVRLPLYANWLLTSVCLSTTC